MNKYFISHPNNLGYLYCSENTKKLYLINVFDYMIDEHLITPTNELNQTISTLKKLCSIGSHTHFINNQVDYKTYTYNLIFNNYYLKNEKLLTLENAYFFLDKTQKNYEKLTQAFTLMNTLIDFSKQYANEMKKIHMQELKKYVSLDELYSQFSRQDLNFLLNHPSLKNKNANFANYFSFTEFVKEKYPTFLLVDSHLEIFNNPFLAYIKRWDEILDNEHAFPIELIQENSLKEFFQATCSYAIFTEENNVSGYLRFTDEGVSEVDVLSKATLFKSIEEAEAKMNCEQIEGVICEVHVNLVKKVKEIKGASYPTLDSALISIEQEALMNHKSSHTVAKELLVLLGDNDHELKQHIELFLKQPRDTNKKPQKGQKI